jgi:hypothetical protein
MQSVPSPDQPRSGSAYLLTDAANPLEMPAEDISTLVPTAATALQSPVIDSHPFQINKKQKKSTGNPR